MASIKKRPDGKWRARFRDGTGREVTRHFARRVDGQEWLDQTTAAVVTGQYVNPKAGKIIVRDYAVQWQAAQVWRENTARRIDKDLRVHVLPVLGDRPIASIRPSDMRALVKGLSEHLAPSTVKVVYATVRSMFKAAVEDRIIASSPCQGVKVAPGEPKSLTIPAVETVHEIADQLPGRLRAVVYVAAGLGLRPGEVFGLQVADVDFLRRTVKVERQLDERSRLGPLKTTASYRTVPLPEVVALELASHLAGRNTSELVFTGVDGLPVKRNSFTKVWRRAVVNADAPEGLRFHDLRHVFASALIDAGESVKVVQKRMGHSSAAMTLDVYSHLWPSSDERSRAAIDAAFGIPADSLRTGNA